MGTFAEGLVTICFKKDEDGKKVKDLISQEETEQGFIQHLGDEGQGSYTFFEFNDEYKSVVEFKVCSDRVQNAEWQVDNLVKLIEVLVKKGEVEAPEEFQAELMIQERSWHMSADEFESDEDA